MAVRCQLRLAQQEQSQQGKTAFQCFVAHGSKQDRVVLQRQRDSLHHFDKLRLWITAYSSRCRQQQIQMQQQQQMQMQKQQQMQQESKSKSRNAHHDSHNSSHDDGIAVDPICLAFAALTLTTNGNNNNNNSGGKDDCRFLRKSMFHSYREVFDQTMQQLETRYKQYTLLPIDTTEMADSTSSCCWQTILTQAVKDGTPAIFSDYKSLQAYTLEKLAPRCRQLHHLILDHDNPFAKSIRALLLPKKAFHRRRRRRRPCDGVSHDTKQTETKSPAVVSVCSIGGGPGYDHIAICMVAQFLHQLLSSSSTTDDEDDEHHYQQVTIQTRIFDLWNESWDPIAAELLQCWNEIHPFVSSESPNPCDASAAAASKNQMTMHPADLRLPLLAPSNRELDVAIPNADLIVFQFVLHENAAFLQSSMVVVAAPTTTTAQLQEQLRQQQQEQQQPESMSTVDATVNHDESAILATTMPNDDDVDIDIDDKLSLLCPNNALADVLRCAKVGALIVCTDSVHTLWPVLQTTAAWYGWKSMSNAQRRHNIVMGPNSFLLMERMNLGKMTPVASER